MSLSLRPIVVFSIVVLFATVTLPGCGGSPDMAPVSGTVLVGGQPVEGAQVLFVPVGKRPAAGQTDKDGRFQLSTVEENDGAVIGEHSVTIMYQKPIHVQPMGPAGEGQKTVGPPPPPLSPNWKSPIPAKYSNPAAPVLSAEVKEGKNDFKFELEW